MNVHSFLLKLKEESISFFTDAVLLFVSSGCLRSNSHQHGPYWSRLCCRSVSAGSHRVNIDLLHTNQDDLWPPENKLSRRNSPIRFRQQEARCWKLLTAWRTSSALSYHFLPVNIVKHSCCYCCAALQKLLRAQQAMNDSGRPNRLRGGDRRSTYRILMLFTTRTREYLPSNPTHTKNCLIKDGINSILEKI